MSGSSDEMPDLSWFSRVSLPLSDEEADWLFPGPALNLHLQGIQATKAEYLEKMAAAFILETGLPASEIELVQQDLPAPQVGVKFYYRARE